MKSNNTFGAFRDIDESIYDFIPIRPSTTSTPTFLYSLAPIGIGTPFVESLSSYTCRLASAHMLSVSTLLREVIAPHLHVPNHSLGNVIGQQTITRYMNGMDKAAIALVSVLEKLTERTDLAYLTMRPFSGLLSHYELLSQASSWCPYCLEQQLAMGQPPHYPLLWFLRHYTKCAVHRRQLLTVCPYCKATSPIIASRTVMGYCPQCKSWLGSLPNGKIRIKYSVAGNFFVRLFEWQNNVGCEREHSTFPSMLEYLIGSKLRKQDIESFARLLNLPDSIIHSLLSGKMLLALGVVLHMSKIFKLDPMDILTISGEEMSRKDDAESAIADNFMFNADKVNWSQMHGLLRDVACGKASSMRVEDIARVYKCPLEEIECRYPEFCAQIKKRFNSLMNCRQHHYLPTTTIFANITSINANRQL